MARDVWVHHRDLTIKLTPWYDESHVFIRLDIYRQQRSPMQIDDEEIGRMKDSNNKIKILSVELKWSFLR